MKLSLLTLFFFSVITNADTQSLSWQWAYAGTSGSVQATGNIIETDPSGNIYVAGEFYSDTLIIANDTLVNANSNGYSENIYLLKFSPSGSIIWSKTLGGPNISVLNPVLTVDAYGYAVLGGKFRGGTLVLGNGELTNKDSLGNNSPFFLVKYTPAGDVIWAWLGDSTLSIAGLSSDATGNIYATGNFIAPGSIWGTSTLTCAGYLNAFIGKFDPEGTKVWAEGLGGTQYDNAVAISTDASGNSYITGIYTSPTFVAGTDTLKGAGGSNVIFTAKYDPTGNALWLKSATGSGGNRASAITADNNGHAFITGTVSGDAVIDFGNLTLVNPDTNYGDFFLAEYDPTGNVTWATSPQANNQTSGNAITLGSNGNIYVAGSFSDKKLVFGPDVLVNPDTIDNQPEALFIAQYDTAGNAIGAIGAGGGRGGVEGNSISTDAAGGIYVTGNFSSSILVFGNDSLTGTTVDEGETVFIAKHGPISTGITNIPDGINTITVYPNPSAGQFYFKGIKAGNTLEVYDMLEQNIFSSEVTGDNYLLNIAGRATGVYLYRVVSNATIVQQGKVVLE